MSAIHKLIMGLSPVGYWPLNAPNINGATAYDLSGNARNGTIQFTPAYRTVLGQSVLDFSGGNASSSPYVIINNFSQFSVDTSPITISAFFVQDTNAGNILSKLESGATSVADWLIRTDVGSGNGVAVPFNTTTGNWATSTDFGSPFTAGIPQHLCVQFQNSNPYIKTWKNGVLINSQPSLVYTVDGGTARMFIGYGGSATGTSTFDGAIHDVFITNSALTDQQIKSLYEMNLRRGGSY